MNKHNKGFVLMETIVVICVLCVILIMLYGAYSNILTDVEKKSVYNNTEYIYKTSVLRDYLEDKVDIAEYMGSSKVKTYCSDQLVLYDDCESIEGNEVFSFLGVKGIYFVLWDEFAEDTNLSSLEPTTQQYIKTIDAEVSKDAYRIMVVMYESENNSSNSNYEYAYLRFGSRG